MGKIALSLGWLGFPLYWITKLTLEFGWPGLIVVTLMELSGKNLSLQQFQAVMIAGVPIALIVKIVRFLKARNAQ